MDISLVAAREDYSPVAVYRLIIAVALLAADMGSRAFKLQ